MTRAGRWATPTVLLRVGVLVACGVLLVGAALWAGQVGPWTAAAEPAGYAGRADIHRRAHSGRSTDEPAPVVRFRCLRMGPQRCAVCARGGAAGRARVDGGGDAPRPRWDSVGARDVGPPPGDRVEGTPPEPDPSRPFDARAAADYVIGCWEVLERRAAALGRPRRPEATPTEYVQVLRGSYPLPADAAAELLGLYQRARFDHQRLQPDTAVRAWACLQRLLAELDRARVAP